MSSNYCYTNTEHTNPVITIIQILQDILGLYVRYLSDSSSGFEKKIGHVKLSILQVLCSHNFFPVALFCVALDGLSCNCSKSSLALL